MITRPLPLRFEASQSESARLGRGFAGTRALPGGTAGGGSIGLGEVCTPGPNLMGHIRRHGFIPEAHGLKMENRFSSGGIGETVIVSMKLYPNRWDLVKQIE